MASGVAPNFFETRGRSAEPGADDGSWARCVRAPARCQVKKYAYEQAEKAALEPEDETWFRCNQAAWTFFQAQPAGYLHQIVWRIVSAKRAETRQTRLAKLIEASANGRRL